LLSENSSVSRCHRIIILLFRFTLLFDLRLNRAFIDLTNKFANESPLVNRELKRTFQRRVPLAHIGIEYLSINSRNSSFKSRFDLYVFDWYHELQFVLGHRIDIVSVHAEITASEPFALADELL
jgi:hypothetical protein